MFVYCFGNKSGLDVTACDIAYYHSGEKLKKGLKDIEHAMEHMQKAQNNYKWYYFNDIEGPSFKCLTRLYQRLGINAILNVYISDCIRMYSFELYMHTLHEVERNACTTRYNNRNKN